MKLSYEELEAKCAALAAENAGMKQNAVKAEKVIMSSKFDYWSDRVELSAVVGRIIETPATDAFMAEVRAQGVDSAVETITVLMNPKHLAVAEVLFVLRTHAEQLRKGVQL